MTTLTPQDAARADGPRALEPPRVRAALLDCLQANLAVLADRHHGPDTHLRLGAVLRFAPAPHGPGGLPTVEPTVEDQLAAAGELLGLAVRARATGRPGTAPDGPAEPSYVVADAFHLPWVPYHGHRHVEHSFLVEPDADGVTVTDAYHNDTTWGPARPLRLSYRREQLDVLLAALPEDTVTVRLSARPPGPAPAPVHAPAGEAAVDAYLRAYADHEDRVLALERFTLETWLLARARHLHAAYAARLAGGAQDETVRAHLARWDGVVEHTYLAYRRAVRGRAEPAGLFERVGEALRADAAVFGGRRPRTPEDLEDEVRAVVAEVLHVPADSLVVGAGGFDGNLSRLAEFGSMRMVEVVERLEQRFAVEFAPEDLVPENLHRVDDLCALIRRAPSAR
ncbi:acyl carrier protein [Streptomyces sp. Tu 3180]|uniref:acyl carrier protein n=1 Tax=Streptomyces sp. Tu 3180 TaxID=2682611 RepID=UPI00135B8D9F|nr:acyl carrier protein [Streptomyces sp. Tu 3180]KAF3463511.1 acyl carrier protein [Streptomyces sp. Tu 3180]